MGYGPSIFVDTKKGQCIQMNGLFSVPILISPRQQRIPLAQTFQNMDVTVTNYVNLDMVGMNWPGNWALF